MAIVIFNAKSPHVEDLKRSPERSFRIGAHMVNMKQRWLPGGDGGTVLKHGASVYDAAFVLADYLNRSAFPLAGKRVIELGCGPGLGSIGAALSDSSVKEVIATDGDEELLSLTKENLDINVTRTVGLEVRKKCRCELLMWGNNELCRNLDPPFDVILAADCVAVVYENAFNDLIQTFTELSNNHSIILLSYHRRHHSEDNFFVLLSERFSWQEVSAEFIHPDFADSDITIFEIKLK